MTNTVMDAARMMDMLPQSEQEFAYEFIKKLVRAWDPDYTKVTSEEARQIAHAEESGFIDADEIDWDNLGGITQ